MWVMCRVRPCLRCRWRTQSLEGSFIHLGTPGPTGNCLEFHGGDKAMGVPRHLIRSCATVERANTDLLSGGELITHRTPLADRWGGWFVTGTHGAQVHRGNLIGADDFARQQREP